MKYTRLSKTKEIEYLRRTLKTKVPLRGVGKSTNVYDYSDREIQEMHIGIHKDIRHLMVDGNYFIGVDEIISAGCELAGVTYARKLFENNWENSNQMVQNIKTFYVKSYYVVTKEEVEGKLRHEITTYLHSHKESVLRKGRGRFANSYGIKNDGEGTKYFRSGDLPEMLFYPIKTAINKEFFGNHFAIDNFIVEGAFAF